MVRFKKRKGRWGLYLRVARTFWLSEHQFVMLAAMMSREQRVLVNKVLQEIVGRSDLKGYTLYQELSKQGALSWPDFRRLYRSLPVCVRRKLEERAIKLVGDEAEQRIPSMNVAASFRNLHVAVRRWQRRQQSTS